MNEAEKREFLSQLVDNVQIYEERKENGQWLKFIEFKLPIMEKGESYLKQKKMK